MKNIVLYIPLLGLLLGSCTERIEINTDNAPPHIVIYGHLSTDTMQHSIRVTRTAGYFTTEAPEGIAGATVTITTDDQTIRLFENDTMPGLYQTRPGVYGLMGKTYTLDVLADFDNDKRPEHYQSEAYLTHINHIDSIELAKVPGQIIRRDSLIELRVYAQDLPEENIYSIFIAINDSIINATVNRFFFMSDAIFNGKYMDGIPCHYFRPKTDDDKPTLKIGDIVTLNINAESREYADFIGNVREEVGGQNPIFDGPPANVEGNVRCIDPPDAVQVSGFFTAFPSRYARLRVDKDYTEERKKK